MIVIFPLISCRSCKTFGRQSWVIVAIIITEFLVIAKFDFETITKPLPVHITYFWILGFCTLFVWTLWKFFLIPKLNSPKKVEKSFSNEAITALEENTKKESNGNLRHRSSGKFED